MLTNLIKPGVVSMKIGYNSAIVDLPMLEEGEELTVDFPTGVKCTLRNEYGNLVVSESTDSVGNDITEDMKMYQVQTNYIK